MDEFTKKALGRNGGAEIGAKDQARSDGGGGGGAGDVDSGVEDSTCWWSQLCANKHLTKHAEFHRVRGITPPDALDAPNLVPHRCSPICQTRGSTLNGVQ